jgi:hypothetical protein
VHTEDDWLVSHGRIIASACHKRWEANPVLALSNNPDTQFLFLKTPVCLQKQAQNCKKQPLFWAINSSDCSSASRFGLLPLCKVFSVNSRSSASSEEKKTN